MEPTALRDLLETHHQACFGWALHCCGGERPAAEDVLQTAYLRMLQGRAVYRGEAPFRTWAFGVIWRCASEERRRRWWRWLGVQRWERQRPEPPAPETPAEAMERTTAREACRKAMNALSPRQRSLLHLVFYQDMTLEEASGVLGISIGSARTHYDRAKKQMARRLAEAGAHEPSGTGHSRLVPGAEAE